MTLVMHAPCDGCFWGRIQKDLREQCESSDCGLPEDTPENLENILDAR